MLRLRQGRKEEKQAASQQLVKETNITLIFNLISKYGSASRAQLAHATGLSPTTVSSLAEELIENDIIIETGEGATKTSGRKPIMLEVNPSGGYISCIEINDSGYNFALYNLKCKQVVERKIITSQYSTIGHNIAQIIEDTLKQFKIHEDKLFGICLGVPGLIDLANNRVTTSTVIPIDESNDFYDCTKERFIDTPVFLGNESWFSAYAEKEFGTNGMINNLVFIDINTGVGAGIILNGQVFTGAFGLAAEIGHMSIDMNGPNCKCGNRGCLETMVSIPAICELYKKKSNQKEIKVDIEFLYHALKNDDQFAKEVVELTAKRLAFGITNILNFINPEVVVIGGKITKLGIEFLDKIRFYMEGIQLKPNKGKIEIKYSTLKVNTVTLGEARYVLDNILNPGVLLDDSNLNLY